MVTSDSFSFTYGTIEVRAKMPKGDWLWPGNNENENNLNFFKWKYSENKLSGCCPLMKFTEVGHNPVRLISLKHEETPIFRAMVLQSGGSWPAARCIGVPIPVRIVMILPTGKSKLCTWIIITVTTLINTKRLSIKDHSESRLCERFPSLSCRVASKWVSVLHWWSNDWRNVPSCRWVLGVGRI